MVKMADKEVQISKNSTVSAVSSGKKASSDKPGSSNTQTTHSSNTKPHTKESGGNMKEVLEILRVLNSNVKAQNERLDKQEKCINDMMSGEAWPEESQSYDDGCDNYEYECEPLVPDSETVHLNNDGKEKDKSIFEKLSDKFQQNEKCDVDVHPDLAKLVNSSFRNGLSDEQLDEIVKEVHRPQNCDSLVKTRVNQGIWRLLKPYTQAEDSRLTNIQGILMKASVEVVKLVEQLGAIESEHLELGTTAIALLGQVNKMINSRRKDLHKFDLDHKYHYLASASLPYTDLLYGNDVDVNNNVREINNMNRIGKNSRGGGPVRGRGRGRRGFNPYFSRGRGFRGRGRGFDSRMDSTNTAKNSKAPQKK